MDQLIPSLERLLAPLAVAFRCQVYPSFCLKVVAWIVCLGRRTISRVWETTGPPEQRSYAAAYDDTQMHLVGLGADGRMAFEYEYPTNDCGNGWNSQPIPFEDLDFE